MKDEMQHVAAVSGRDYKAITGAEMATRKPAPWIQTFTGQRFTFDPIDPHAINVEDIAHALSRANRWAGHTAVPWTVAQHSILVALLVPERHRREALFHDASEAYLADVAAPVKAILPDYQALEKRLEHAIAIRFGLTFPLPDVVRFADWAVLQLERRTIADWEGYPPRWDTDPPGGLEEVGLPAIPTAFAWAPQPQVKSGLFLALSGIQEPDLLTTARWMGVSEEWIEAAALWGARW